MSPIIVRIPLRTRSGDNQRGHWSMTAARVKAERDAVAWHRGKIPRSWRDQQQWLTVSLTRIAPRPLDGDGLLSSLKACRDQLAVELGLKVMRVSKNGVVTADDSDPAVTWVYGQVCGGIREYAVEVMFT